MIYSEDKFLRRIEEEFTEIKPNSLTPDSQMPKIIEWNSMNVLLFLAFISEDTNVRCTYDEVKQFDTLHDLYNYLAERSAA